MHIEVFSTAVLTWVAAVTVSSTSRNEFMSYVIRMEFLPNKSLLSPSIASTGCSTDHGTQYAPHFVMSWLHSQSSTIQKYLIDKNAKLFFFSFSWGWLEAWYLLRTVTPMSASRMLFSQSLKFITVCRILISSQPSDTLCGGVASYHMHVSWSYGANLIWYLQLENFQGLACFFSSLTSSKLTVNSTIC
jgi:hypothetical protein